MTCFVNRGLIGQLYVLLICRMVWQWVTIELSATCYQEDGKQISVGDTATFAYGELLQGDNIGFRVGISY